MPASKAYYLRDLQIWVAGGYNGAAENPCVEVIDYIYSRLSELDLGKLRKTVCSKDRHSQFYKELGKLVIYQRIIVVGSSGKDDGKIIRAFKAFKHLSSGCLKLGIKHILSIFPESNSLFTGFFIDPEGLFHVGCDLIYTVFPAVPVKIGRIKFNVL